MRRAGAGRPPAAGQPDPAAAVRTIGTVHGQVLAVQPQPQPQRAVALDPVTWTCRVVARPSTASSACSPSSSGVITGSTVG